MNTIYIELWILDASKLVYFSLCMCACVFVFFATVLVFLCMCICNLFVYVCLCMRLQARLYICIVLWLSERAQGNLPSRNTKEAIVHTYVNCALTLSERATCGKLEPGRSAPASETGKPPPHPFSHICICTDSWNIKIAKCEIYRVSQKNWVFPKWAFADFSTISSQLAAGSPNAQFSKTQFFWDTLYMQRN